MFKSTGFMIPGKSRLIVRAGGALWFVEPKTNSLAILAGLHEPRTIGWFKVEPNDVVVDVGAHIGRYSLIAARMASRVVSIEPEDSNFKMLVDNIRLNGFSNISPLQLALSDSPGNRLFYIATGGDTGTHSVEPEWRRMLDTKRRRKSITVRCETLDRVVISLGLARIDWLKIDVEGHEIEVLKGSTATLSITRNLILEVAEGNEDACRKQLGKAGMRLVSIDQGRKERGIRASSNWLLTRA
jgi:FkbM family methyltransferase